MSTPQNKPLSKIALTALCSGMLFSSIALADGKAYYEVTVTNLTRAQTFTPILVASHYKGVKLFELGSPASNELTALAEGGDVAPLTTALQANDKVIDTKNSGGLLMPGQSVTVTVSASRGAKQISLASMMIPTNDSFIALNGVKAPKHGKTAVYYSSGYDVGSEPNDELCMNIPGPVCGGAGGSPEAGGEGYVHISGGISGKADLTADTYDWRNPTAKIAIKRVRISEQN
jgi:archaellum component FlaF (FlaF/FlaG flagellin family)